MNWTYDKIETAYLKKCPDQFTYPTIMEVGFLDYDSLIEFLEARQCLYSPPRFCDAKVIKSDKFAHGYQFK